MDVCLPNTRLRDNNSSSINEIANMPLGTSVAIVTKCFNDDDVITDQINHLIPDSVTRNSQYNEQQLNYNKRDLVGKKSKVLPSSIFDQQVVQEFNIRNNDKIAFDEYRHLKLSYYNLVSFPMTKIEKFVIP